MRDFPDKVEDMRELELPEHRPWGLVDVRPPIGAMPAVVSVEPAELQSLHGLLLESIIGGLPVDALIGIPMGAAESLQVALVGREVVEAGQGRQVAQIAARQNSTPVDQAVDGLQNRRQLVRDLPSFVFQLAVVREKADGIGIGRHRRRTGDLVIGLHVTCIHLLFGATFRNACGQPRTYSFMHLRRDLAAQTAGNPIRICRAHGLMRDSVCWWYWDSLAVEHQLDAVSALIDAPVKCFMKGVQPLCVATRASLQEIRVESVGQRQRPLSDTFPKPLSNTPPFKAADVVRVPPACYAVRVSGARKRDPGEGSIRARPYAVQVSRMALHQCRRSHDRSSHRRSGADPNLCLIPARPA